MSSSTLPPDTHIGHAHLQVSDLDDVRTFYQDLIGFKPVDLKGKPNSKTLALSATGDQPIQLIFTESPNPEPRPRHTTGLFHLAIRLPDRTALAQLFQRLVDANYPFQGFSDHKVSEALYLADPEGNGLELYRDRPRDQWPKQGDQIAMRTDPLDVQDLLASAQNGPYAWAGIHPQTDIGHIHLQVSDLSPAENFYHRLIGLDVTQRTYPGALFFSAGGYHHHIGTNIWNSRGGSPPPEDSVGLVSFSIHLSAEESWKELVSRLRHSYGEVEKWIDYGASFSALIHDPFGIGVELSINRSHVKASTLSTLNLDATSILSPNT